ncbi:hypothetical protein [Burkholderia gladioli]|uniref:hypothetical protein n=1 Tax=Burkholderia gladioli TaxID=28095 RepID=UPI001641FC78
MLAHPIRLHACAGLLPAIKRLHRNTDPANQIRQRHPRFRLFQYRHNLFDRKAPAFHGRKNRAPVLDVLAPCRTVLDTWALTDDSRYSNLLDNISNKLESAR